MTIYDLFTHPGFVIISGILTLFLLISIVSSVIAFFTGIWPVWFRLGTGLANRNIAVLADNTKFNELKALLVESGIFKEKNITQIFHGGEIKKASDITLLLVYWKDFNKEIDDIISNKKHAAALIVYAPHEDGRLLPDEMNKLSSHRNTILVTFKGRLLNDIVSSVITTAYKK